MYTGLYSSHDRIYSFEELSLPLTGVDFTDRSGAIATRPYIAFNMVSSVDGKATTHHGQLTGLGSRPDRLLMKRLRSQFDAVLVGGGTLRHDVFAPTVPPELMPERLQHFAKPQPLGIVISNSGDLPSENRFWEGEQSDRVLLVGENTEIQDWMTARSQIYRFPAPQQEIDLTQVLKFLFEQLGVKRLLVEGGAVLNYALMSQGLADEIFLSIAPYIVGGVENMTIVGGAGYGMGGGDLTKLKLRSIYQADSELFLRYQWQPCSTV